MIESSFNLDQENLESLTFCRSSGLFFFIYQGLVGLFSRELKESVVVLIFKKLVFKNNNTILIHLGQLAFALS